LTVVVSERSKPETIRLFISSAGRPVYCHTTETTGISMFGKMSVGVRRIARGTEDQQEQRENDKRERSLKRDFDDPHNR
jgi:hypothetical protein